MENGNYGYNFPSWMIALASLFVSMWFYSCLEPGVEVWPQRFTISLLRLVQTLLNSEMPVKARESCHP